MEPLTLPIYNTEGKEVDTLKLDAKVFNGTLNKAAIYQAVCAYRANQRKGLAATKTRGEVSGGGRKPWRQKGTGRARAGSIRSPLWRHGGVIFGPHPRDFSYSLPKKIKRLALISSLNEKLNESNIIVLDGLNASSPKTKEMAGMFSKLKLSYAGKRKYSNLLLLDKLDNKLKLALRNIGSIDVNLAKDTHVYELMSHRKLIITKDGLEALVHRLTEQ